MLPIPPIKGTRKLHWYTGSRDSFSHAQLPPFIGEASILVDVTLSHRINVWYIYLHFTIQINHMYVGKYTIHGWNLWVYVFFCSDPYVNSPAFEFMFESITKKHIWNNLHLKSISQTPPVMPGFGCLRCFFTFCHGRSPSNHHFREYYVTFLPSIEETNPSSCIRPIIHWFSLIRLAIKPVVSQGDIFMASQPTLM